MKLNRIFAGIMAICVMGMGVPYVNAVTENNTVMTVNAEEEADYTEGTYEKLTYKNYGDYIEISDCAQFTTEIVIPAEIDGVLVTSIGDGAFDRHRSLISVEIPDSITSIGNGAFLYCESLKSVEIPAGVTSIGDDAFWYCINLTSINIPDGLTHIGNNVFSGCESLTSVEIPDSIISIGDGAFSGCKSLTSIKIPDSITSIGDFTFFCCSSLKSIEMPDCVTSIGDWVFDGCESLISVEIPASLTSMGAFVFDDTPWLKEKRKENPLVIEKNILIDGTTCSGDIVIPDGVTIILNRAFQLCLDLTSVEIPDSVTSIGNGAFSSCHALTSIEIPDSVTSIGEYAFYYCRSLTEITVLNPDCEIYDGENTIANSVNEDGQDYFNGTIKGYENSTVQAYAEKYNRKFVSLGEAPEKEIITGDINGDNKVSIADAVLLQSYILGRKNLTEEQFKNADLTGDGVVDAFDMILLRRMIIENNK